MIKGLQFLKGFAATDKAKLPHIGNRIFEFKPGFNVLFGPNGCLAEGTLVATSKGLVPIEDIKVGDIVYSEHNEPIRVLQTFNTGVKEVVEIKSSDKCVAESTLDHVWLAKQKGSDKKYRGTQVSDFVSKVKIRRVYPVAPLGDVVVPDAYFLGVALGDGCCRQSTTQYHISSADEAVIAKCAAVTGGTYCKLNGENYTWEIKVDKRSELYDAWCRGRYAHEKIVDIKVIREWSRQTLLEFVAGVIDSDGSVYTRRNNQACIAVSMQARPVIQAMQFAFLTLWGIDCNITQDCKEKYVNGPCHQIKVVRVSDTIRVLKELSPFLSVETKQFKPEYEYSGSRDGSYLGVVLGDKRRVQTYDIHVDSPTNLYCLANGLVTHNSGKSVCINTMKAYCGIPTGGWTRINDPTALGTSSVGQFPYAYRTFVPGQCDAWVGWDGTPTFFNDGDIKVDSTFFFDKERQSADGITSEAEQFDALATKPSSGQYRIQRINKIMQVIQTPPDLKVVPDHIHNKEHAKCEIQYFASLPRKGPMTLLFDEPERAIAIHKQKELFDILAILSDSYQVIVASHSPFVLFHKDANLIDIEPGYSDQCRDIFRELPKGWRSKKPKK